MSKDAWPALNQHQLEVITAIANAVIAALNPSGFPHRYAVAIVVGPLTPPGSEQLQNVPVTVNSNLAMNSDRKNLLEYAANVIQAVINDEAPGGEPPEGEPPVDAKPGRLN